MAQVVGPNTGAVSTGRFGRRFTASQDFELNLAPIIDCLTVLIAFVLISASYLSIGVLDAGVAASGSTQTTSNDSPVSLSIDLRRDHSILVSLSGKIHRDHAIPPGPGGSWDYNALIDHLAFVKSEWPMLQQAVLMADNSVDYQQVIKSMEITRKAVPSVFLGGF